jgi:cutinase
LRKSISIGTMPDMRKKSLTLTATATLAATLLVAGPARADWPPATGCADVEVVAVRGTNESTPIGVLGYLAYQVTTTTSKTVATYGLPYPATSDWVSSVNSGKSMLAAHLAQQSAACPSQKFVLLGYSQGAWVVGDSLAGGGGGFPPPISAALGQKVAAVVMYGDPRYRSGEPFVAGTAGAAGTRINGIIPRDPGALATYASRTRSYCEIDDPICQYGGPGGSGHFAYTSKYTTAAGAFVVSKLT